MKTPLQPKKADDTWGEAPLFRPQVGLVNVSLNVDLRRSGVIAATIVALTLFFTGTTGAIERVHYATRFALALVEQPTFWMFVGPLSLIAGALWYGIRWWRTPIEAAPQIPVIKNSKGTTMPTIISTISTALASEKVREQDTLMRLSGKNASYDVLRRMGVTPTFTLYEGKRVSDERSCIIKVAKTVAENATLDREALVLKHLSQAAADLETEYARTKKGPEMLNYHFCFPDLVESFISETQGGRRI